MIFLCSESDVPKSRSLTLFDHEVTNLYDSRDFFYENQEPLSTPVTLLW
jgi:hypothetical protein